MHEMNLIHRNISPQNCLIGLKQKSNIIHIVDMSQASPIFVENNHISQD